MNRERGQATVEFALSLPLVALLLAAVIEVALVAVDQTRLWAAAREAARIAVVSSDPGDIRGAAEAAGPIPLDIEVRPGPAERTQGAGLVVRLEHDHAGRLPIVGRLFDRTLVATATMRIERP